MSASPDGPEWPDLRVFLWPASIAVVGASSNERRLGGRLLANLRQRDYPGALYPVNPGHAEIQGLPAYASVAELPEAPDLVLILVRAELVAGILAECAAVGARGAVIYTSGFAEAGADWAGAETAIAELATAHGMMVSGPNAQGFFNARGRIGATFSPTITYPADAAEPLSRKVSVIAQSGGVGFSIFNRARVRGLGFNYVISTGNEAGLDGIDFAEFVLGEAETEVLAMFVEGFRQARRFAPLAQRAAEAGKPLIVAKVGRSESGRRAAVSHTASLAGSSAAFDAVARHWGVIGADDPDEMVDVAAAFANCPLPAGRRLGVVTTSGGSGVWLADTGERYGLQVPALSPQLQEAITAILPYFGATANPVDVTAQTAHDGGVFRVLDVLLDCDEVDLIAVAGPLASEGFITTAADDLKRIARDRRKPVLFYAYSLPSAVNVERLAAMGIHCYTSLPGIASALCALADYAAFQERRRARPAITTAAPAPALPPPGPATTLCEYEVMPALAAWGLATAPGVLATDEAAAVAAAAELGYPVALKVQSPDIPHKADAGGLALGLADEAQVRRAWAQLMNDCREALPDADIRGALVQEMCAPGHEMLAGVLRDADYGPLVMVGMGGAFAEARADTVMAPAPIGPDDALDMIGRLKGAAQLAGGRGRPPADVEALADVVATLSRLAVAWGDDVAELDLNPVIVYGLGQGVRVVDALMVR